ncbi:MAG TPA: VOC family protein [Actinomycetota bacterium]|nr:VOC family protein [Actinomycetota bacterium]
MGDVTHYPNGTFCWIDLATPDVAGARAFYGDLLGWEMDDLPAEQGGTWTMCRLRGKAVAAIHEDPDEPAEWDSFISVDDVDATTLRAGELGATVLVDPFDVPDAGRMSVLRDPVDAVVSLWQPRGRIGAEYVNDVGAWNWNELVTPEIDRATAFYGELFGWTSQELPVQIRRASLQLGDLLIGGVHAPTPPEGDAARWTISFTVDDADRAAARTEALGGRVLLPPMAIPNGTFTIVADPAGAAITLAAAPGGPLRGVDGS